MGQSWTPTVVVRNQDSLFAGSNGLDRTEFFWSYRDGAKTLEVEEISSAGYQFDAYYLNRYVHSERETGARVTRHLDGAVKVYPADRYRDRLSARLPNEARCLRKVKLGRMDGDIDLAAWADLMCFFFRSNEMLIEYFMGAVLQTVTYGKRSENVGGQRLRHCCELLISGGKKVSVAETRLSL